MAGRSSARLCRYGWSSANDRANPRLREVAPAASRVQYIAPLQAKESLF